MRARLLVLVLLLLTGCTPGQKAGGMMMGLGGVMVVGGFTTATPCTRDRPCYEGAQPITHGSEESRPRSVPVGVVGAVLIGAGAILMIASAPAHKPTTAASTTAPPR